MTTSIVQSKLQFYGNNVCLKYSYGYFELLTIMPYSVLSISDYIDDNLFERANKRIIELYDVYGTNILEDEWKINLLKNSL